MKRLIETSGLPLTMAETPLGALRAVDRPYGQEPVARPRRGFTLIEFLVSLSIISILLSISAFSYRSATEGAVLARAKNALITYTKVARGYAIANRVETMLAVNPFNGRFEIWHMNHSPHGGAFDVMSNAAPPGNPPPALIGGTDGYAFAPVLDSGARLPVNANGRPMAVVSPIDFDDPIDPSNPGGAKWRSTVNDPAERNFDNLTWAAVCFDQTGKLVVRTRRIATRTYTLRDGSLNGNTHGPNRLPDESPDLSLRDIGAAMVIGGPDGDTPITTARGFVVSEMPKLRQVVGGTVTPSSLVNNWLIETGPNGQYRDFATRVFFNHYSGQDIREEP
jgi:prepilin-type N-terminal cleavage/methylation domain-containing protein